MPSQVLMSSLLCKHTTTNDDCASLCKQIKVFLSLWYIRHCTSLKTTSFTDVVKYQITSHTYVLYMQEIVFLIIARMHN